MTERFHDPGYVDVVGAAQGAGRAGQAHPDGFGAQYLFLQAELNAPHDLVGLHVIVWRCRTAGRAVAALVTVADVLPAFGLNLFLEGRVL